MIGIGRGQLPISMMTLIMGVHVGVGMEDNICYRWKELAKTSGPFVERVVNITREYGRQVVSRNETRAVVGFR